MYRAFTSYYPEYGEKLDLTLKNSADICTGDYYRDGEYLTDHPRTRD
jgi:hypothetical protein